MHLVSCCVVLHRVVLCCTVLRLFVVPFFLSEGPVCTLAKGTLPRCRGRWRWWQGRLVTWGSSIPGQAPPSLNLQKVHLHTRPPSHSSISQGYFLSPLPVQYIHHQMETSEVQYIFSPPWNPEWLLNEKKNNDTFAHSVIHYSLPSTSFGNWKGKIVMGKTLDEICPEFSQPFSGSVQDSLQQIEENPIFSSQY